MKHLWWKVLGMVLMIYAVLAGMLIPLKPGIVAVAKTSVSSGVSTSIEMTPYQYDFGYLDQTIAYLKQDTTRYIVATNVQAKDNTQLTIDFNIPPVDRTQPFTLEVTDPYNGTIVFPDGITVKANDSVETVGLSWKEGIVPTLYKKEGFLYPYRNILLETIRNTFYHVTLWMAMFVLLFVSTITSGLYLKTNALKYDHMSYALILVGTLYGILGLITGAFWGKATWGTYWTTDVKLNMAAISMLIYVAYLILRSSMDNVDQRARIGSAYAIFAFFALIPLLLVIPRLTDSLHPGNGGNPALGGEDLDNKLRLVFYPAIIGFTLIGVWMGQLIYRYKLIQEKIMNKYLG